MSSQPTSGADRNFPAFLARQPILDADQRIVGYELLYRDTRRNVATVLDVRQATASVIVNTLGIMGLSDVSGGQPVYINFDAADLCDNAAELLPPERVVLEILETAVPSAGLLARCREWKQMGYRLALDDFVYQPTWEPFLDVVDIVKLDLRQLTGPALEAHVHQAKAHGLIVIAEKVEDRGEFEHCRQLGCDAFQGYFFARPEILEDTKLPATSVALLNLLRRVQEDADIPDLEHPLSRDTGLLYRLLRYAGSVSFGARPPQNLRSALTRLGRRNLQRWLMLELYASASADNAGAEPLLDVAGYRAELMTILAEAGGHPVIQADEAGAVGCLSLLDALLHRPMAQIIDGIALPEAMRAALLAHDGPLGDMLSLMQALEQSDTAAVARICGRLGLPAEELPTLQAQALKAQHRLIEAMRQS
jgi:EAL and modified HD-GYP domain-containing signal transduction protein